MEKRGLSMIVTSLIIILLAIVAIGVLYVVYINFVRTGVEGISLGKFTIDLEIENAYVEGDNVKVGVERHSGKGDLVAINFIISDGDNSEISREETTLQELGGKSFTIVLSELNIDDVETVSIAPIYKSDSGEEIIGDILDTHKIGRGSGDGDGDECVPDCSGLDCGPDPVCGESCGTCDEGYVCDGTGICVLEEECTDTCVSLGYECGTWTICGVETDCLPGGCIEGTCVEGQCYVEEILNSGVIDSVWPPGVGMYFDSSDLPVDVSYRDYYVKFPDSAESECLLIYDYIFPVLPEIYNKSHIRLGASHSDIVADDNYEIWETYVGCLG